MCFKKQNKSKVNFVSDSFEAYYTFAMNLLKMKRNYLKRLYLIPYTLCLVFFLLSCGENKTISIPTNILSKEKMAEVITDIHLAEAEASMRTVPDSSSKEKLNFRKIFDKHSITKQQYEKSLSFYIEHPEILDEIYEQVLNELSKMQGEVAKGK